MPKFRVKAAPTHSVPIFHSGFEHWNIVHDDSTEHVMCCITFPQADPKLPGYRDYMETQRNRAERLAILINRGLETNEG
jgi:hypothetical protein